MSEAVWINLIGNVATVVIVLGCRLMSHFEHRKNLIEQRQTSSDVADIKATMNGRNHP